MFPAESSTLSALERARQADLDRQRQQGSVVEQRRRRSGRTLPGDSPHAALAWSAQGVLGNSVVQGALAGRMEGPGEMVEGAMTLGAAGVSIADSTEQLFTNSAVLAWMDARGVGPAPLPGVDGAAAGLDPSATGAGEGAAVARRAETDGEVFGDDAPRKLETALSRGGRPLPASLGPRMEAAFGGVDFSGVRIHTDAAAAQAADAIHAAAFAVGPDIYFNRGAWSPQTPAGQHLLAHELTHVVQYMEGRLRPGGGDGGLDVSSPTDPHELEAESRAAEVTRALSSGAVDASLDADANAEEGVDSAQEGLVDATASGARGGALDLGPTGADGPDGAGAAADAAAEVDGAAGGGGASATPLSRRPDDRRGGRLRQLGSGRGDRLGPRAREYFDQAGGGLGALADLLSEANPSADVLLGMLREIFGDDIVIDGSGVAGLAKALTAALGGMGGGIAQTTPGGPGVGEGPTGPTGAGAGGGGGSPSANKAWSIKQGSAGSGKVDGSGAGVRLEGDLAAFGRDLVQTIVAVLGQQTVLDADTIWTRMQEQFPEQMDPTQETGVEGRPGDDTGMPQSVETARPDGSKGEQVSGGFRGGGDVTPRGRADSEGFDPMLFVRRLTGQFNILGEGDLGPGIRQLLQGQMAQDVPGFDALLGRQAGRGTGLPGDALTAPTAGGPGDAVSLLGGGVPAPAIEERLRSRLGGGAGGSDAGSSSASGARTAGTTSTGSASARTSPAGTGSTTGTGSSAGGSAATGGSTAGAGGGSTGVTADTAGGDRVEGDAATAASAGASADTASGPSTGAVSSGGGGKGAGELSSAIQDLRGRTDETAAAAVAPEVVDAAPKTESEEDHDKKVDRFQDGVDGMADLIEDLDAFDDLCDACSDDDSAGKQAALARIKTSGHFKQLARMWAGAQAGGVDRPAMERAFDHEFDGRGFWGSTEEAFALVAQAAKQQAAEDAAAKAARDKLAQASENQPGGGEAQTAAADAGAQAASGGAAGTDVGAAGGGVDMALLQTIVPEQAPPIPGMDALTAVSDEDFERISASMSEYDGIAAQYETDGGRFPQVMEALSAGGGVFLKTAGETAAIALLANFGDKAIGGLLGKAGGSTIPVVGPAVMLLMDPPWTGEYWDTMGKGIVEGWDSMKSAFDFSAFERADSFTDYVGIICAKLADFLSAISSWIVELTRIMNTVSALAMLLGGVLMGLGIALLWLAGVGAPLVAAGGWLIDAGMILGEIGLAMLAISVGATAMALVFRTAAAFMVPAEAYAEQLGGVQEASEAFGKTAGAKVGLSVAGAIETSVDSQIEFHKQSKTRSTESARTEGQAKVEETARTVEQRSAEVERLANETQAGRKTSAREETRGVEEQRATAEKPVEGAAEKPVESATKTPAERPSFVKDVVKNVRTKLKESLRDSASIRREMGRVAEGLRDLGDIRVSEGLRRAQEAADGRVAKAQEALQKAVEHAEGLRGELQAAEGRFREIVRDMDPANLARVRSEIENLRAGLEKATESVAKVEQRLQRTQRVKEGLDQNRYDGPQTKKGDLRATEDRIRERKQKLEEHRSRQRELTEKLAEQDRRIAELEQARDRFKADEDARIKGIEKDVDLQRSRRAAEEVDAHNAALEQARQEVARLRAEGRDAQADFIEQTKIRPNEAPAERRYWEGKAAEAEAWRSTESTARENPYDSQLEAARSERGQTHRELLETADQIEWGSKDLQTLEAEARSARIDNFADGYGGKLRKTVAKEAFERLMAILTSWLLGIPDKKETGTPTPSQPGSGGTASTTAPSSGGPETSTGSGDPKESEAKAHILAIGAQEAWLETMLQRSPPADLEEVKTARDEAVAEASHATEQHLMAYKAFLAEQAVARMSNDTATLISEGQPLRERAQSMDEPLQQARSDEEQRGAVLAGGNPEEIKGSDERAGGLISGLIERLAAHSSDLSQQPDMGGADAGNLTQGQDEASEAAKEHTEASRGYSEEQRGILDQAIAMRANQEEQISSNIEALEQKYAEEQDLLARIQARKAQALAMEQVHRSRAEERAATFNEGYTMLSTWSTWFDQGLQERPGGE